MTLSISCVRCGPGKAILWEEGKPSVLMLGWENHWDFLTQGLRLSLKDYIPFLNENVKSFSIFNIKDHWPPCPDVVPAAETHLYNVTNEKIQLQLPVSHLRLLCLQHNELCVYHMCEMHQRNVTSWCVLEHVCVFVRGRVYLPSPLFLLLPDRPFAQKHRLSSVYFWGLLQAAPGSAAFPPPLLRPSISCFSSVSSWLSNSGVLFSFQWGVRWAPGAVWAGLLTPSQGVSARSTTPDLRVQDLSQLRAGRTGCCPFHPDPPLSSLWSLTRYAKPEPEPFTLSAQAEDDGACPIITIWFWLFWVIGQKYGKWSASHSNLMLLIMKPRHWILNIHI